MLISSAVDRVARPRPTLGVAMGAAAREVRLGFGWSQDDLADRLGCSQAKISRFETGRVEHLDLAFADAVLNELGIRAWFDTRVPGLADRRRQLDRVHARCCGYTGRNLIERGWEVRHEVEIGDGRTRGWIDLLAFRARDAAIYCPEVKTELHDAGAIQRTLTWYERGAWAAARGIGWRPRRMASGLLLLCTAENDGRVSDNRELLRQSFASSSAALAAWIDDAAAPLPSRSIAMIDPRSRRRDWLRPTRSEGRRSAAPYSNYAELASMLA